MSETVIRISDDGRIMVEKDVGRVKSFNVNAVVFILKLPAYCVCQVKNTAKGHEKIQQ